MLSVNKTILQWATEFINAGATERANTELAPKVVVLNLFALIGFSLTLGLGIRGALSGNWALALGLFLAFSLFLSGHLILRFSTHANAYFHAATLVQAVLFLLCLYLVYGGGANDTGPLWIYLLPPVVMFLSGLRWGVTIIAIFVLLYCTIVFFPDNAIGATSYSYEFKTRLLYSFLTLTFLASVYEHSKQKSYTTLDELKQQFELQATQDSLTHLLNRRGMLAIIQYEVERSKRENTPLSFIIADVDHFKVVNDQYGHAAGDSILVKISELMLASIRKQDSIARWGGEEFLLLLPNTTCSQAKHLAETIRQKIAHSTVRQSQVDIQTTLSFGVSEVVDFDKISNAISLADKRLYKAKQSGRNRVVADSEPPEA